MKKLLIFLPFLLPAQQVDYATQVKNKPTLSTINGGSLPAAGSLTKIDGSGRLTAAIPGTDYLASGGGSSLTSLGLGTCVTGQVVYGGSSNPACSSAFTWNAASTRLSLNSTQTSGSLAIGSGTLSTPWQGSHAAAVTANGLLLADGTSATPQTVNTPSLWVHRVGNEAWGANDSVAKFYYRDGASASADPLLLYVEGRETAGNTGTTGKVGITSFIVIENGTGRYDAGYRSSFAGWFQVQKLTNVKHAATGIEINNTNVSGANCDDPAAMWTGGGPCFGLSVVGTGTGKQTAAVLIDTQSGQTSAYYAGIHEAPDSIAHTGLGYNGYAAAYRRLGVALANGANDNVDIKNAGYVLISGPTAGFSITGFTNGYDGRILYLRNGTAQTMTFNFQTGSTATNQIYTETFGNESVPGPGMVTLLYEGNSQKWVILSKSR